MESCDESDGLVKDLSGLARRLAGVRHGIQSVVYVYLWTSGVPVETWLTFLQTTPRSTQCN